MPVGATTVGPVSEATRDRLAEYRDEQGHPHYQAALEALLDSVEAESGGTLKNNP